MTEFDSGSGYVDPEPDVIRDRMGTDLEFRREAARNLLRTRAAHDQAIKAATDIVENSFKTQAGCESMLFLTQSVGASMIDPEAVKASMSPRVFKFLMACAAIGFQTAVETWHVRMEDSIDG